MKKMMFFGVTVMVSMMVFGFGISAAEENGVSDNMMASFAQERPAAEQTSVETEGVLMAALDCGSYGPELCAWIEGLCTQSSPFAADESFCNRNWTQGTCKDCYYQ